MKPIPYDLYMATFGRSNYTQIAVQTFDDGITEEVQTEEVVYSHKWTQNPVEFSNNDIYLNTESMSKKYGKNDVDYLAKFTFLVNQSSDVEVNNKINSDKDYKENPLRIYLEQKDGVGSCEMLPYSDYKQKIKKNDFNMNKLRKFLKRAERRVSNILSINAGNKEVTDLVKSTKLPFSKGHISLSLKNLDEKLNFVQNTKITDITFSDTKENLIMTVHKKAANGLISEKSLICLWDINVARRDPVKILVAIDNVTICRFKGSTDGLFVAALEDG